MTSSFTQKSIAFFLILIVFSLHVFAEKHHRVQIHLKDRPLSELTSLGVALPVVDYKEGVFITGEFSETELQQIKEAGFSYEILITDLTRYYQARNEGYDIDELNLQMRQSPKNGTPYPTPENFMLGSMGGFHTYDELLDDLDAMHALFPDLISPKQQIGSTLTIEGRPVYWVRISSNPEVTQDKPRVLYTALTHAREPASMQQMLFQMWYILENYETDPEIQYLVDHTEMYFVPCVNPDGYIYCETTHPDGGSMHRKNMRVNSNGSIGVDLNRNFGYMWGYDNSGSSPNPSAQTYRGTGPFSEPETQLQKEFAEEYNFILALNNHTFSDLLIYPWGYNDQLTPDGDIFIEYAKVMTRENGYIYGTCYETLNYFANGVSDDWFYGEQTTKDKTFAFTPEAGKPSDGFWPAVHRIEEICAGHTHMNLSLARLALAYAEIEDLSGPFIAERSAEVPFRILNLGQSSPADFTVSLEPLSANILSAGEPVAFTAMEVLETQTGALSIELHPSISTGEEIMYVVSLHNGQFAWNDTITKFYGQPEVLFADPCDNLDNWNTTSWGTSNQHYYSAPGSIADSPGQNYSNNAHTHITLSDPLDLSQSSLVWAEFYMRYDIETNWDYVQFMYSIDNQQTWIPLEGNHTAIGNNNQDTGQPLYHGTQLQWIKEEVDLSMLAGEEEVWLRFRLVSDAFINKEGFYFDDFSVFSIVMELSYHFYLPEAFDFYQHQQLQLDLNQYTSWELEDEIMISWEGNENLMIELTTPHKLTITNTDPFWTGNEIISLSLEDENTQLDQDVEFIVHAVPEPVITGQEELHIAPGSALEFEYVFITVEDAFFSYPDDFTLTLQSGENYSIEGDYTIIPQEDFNGTIAVPLSVSNGFRESETWELSIMVSPEASVEEIAGDTHVYFDPNSRQLVIKAGKYHQSTSYGVALTDLTGRTLMSETFTGDARVGLRHITPGIYIVYLREGIHGGFKIFIP